MIRTRTTGWDVRLDAGEEREDSPTTIASRPKIRSPVRLAGTPYPGSVVLNPVSSGLCRFSGCRSGTASLRRLAAVPKPVVDRLWSKTQRLGDVVDRGALLPGGPHRLDLEHIEMPSDLGDRLEETRDSSVVSARLMSERASPISTAMEGV